MFKTSFWYYKESDDKNDVVIIGIGCIHCGKETVLYMNNMNTNYKDIITSFLLNTVLHHFGMSWIIETRE